jgi:hypothetical protein
MYGVVREGFVRWKRKRKRKKKKKNDDDDALLTVFVFLSITPIAHYCYYVYPSHLGHLPLFLKPRRGRSLRLGLGDSLATTVGGHVLVDGTECPISKATRCKFRLGAAGDE